MPAPIRHRNRTRHLLCLTAVLALASAQAAELSTPSAVQRIAAPAIPEDPHRPATAPGRAAIQASLEQDGAPAALVLAQRSVTESRAAYGPQDDRVTVPLIQLAHVRLALGDAGEALDHYRDAIALAEARGGPRDARLFPAWYGLGYLHLARGQAPAAESAFGTALQLHRLNHGLYSAGQLDILQALAVSARAAGRDEDARQWQIRRIEVAERVHREAPAVLASLYVSAGRWLRDTGATEDAIALHQLALQTLEKNGGREQAALFEPLVELALSGGQRRHDFDQTPLPPGLQPAALLTRAERLLQAMASADPADAATDWTRLGDANFVLGRRDPALAAYAQALIRYRQTGRAAPFDRPAFLRFEPPLATAERPGEIVAEFEVDDSGRAIKPRLVQRQPEDLPEALGSRLLQALRSARLRPVIQDGRAVAAPAQRYRFTVRGDSA